VKGEKHSTEIVIGTS